ncbi:MAG TPA: maleylpyruvate isomerase family mycothiol-dependent enzyme [Streptosporangiaceae bacterium]
MADPGTLSLERYYTGLSDFAATLAGIVASTDETQPIPTCPEWALRQLTTHVGRAHRWAAAIVAGRLTEPLPFREVPDGKLPDDPAARQDWVTTGAAKVVDAVAGSGGADVWTFGGMAPAAFWARRMTHETSMHLADAQLATGHEVVIPADLAADGIDEWLDFVLARGAGQSPLADGQTLHIHATDEGLDGAGEWLVSGTGSGLSVQRGHAKADAAVRGPAGRLQLVLMRRMPAGQPGVEVLGDTKLFDRWLEQTPF